MKFRKTTTGIITLSNQDFYDFDLTRKQLLEAKKRTYENPLLIADKHGGVMRLYTSQGNFRLDYLISYYSFEKGFGKHEAREYDNVVNCSCGKKFPQGKRKLGMEKFKKHFDEIEKLKKDDKQFAQSGGSE